MWDVQSSGAGNFAVEVLGKIPGSDPDTSGWRLLLHFAIRDGELAELLSSTQRAPSNFSTVTTSTGGKFKIVVSIDERSNSWTASFVLPPDVSRPEGLPASTLPQLRGELRPDLNFLNVPPEALSLRLALSDRACVTGTAFSYVVDNVQVGQYRQR